jgi:hypothetical protein
VRARTAANLPLDIALRYGRGVPVELIRMYLTEEKLMESSLYRSAIEKGKAQGEAQALAKVLVRGLTNHLGLLDSEVRDRIHAVTSMETLEAWCSELLLLRDADGARRLVSKIMSVTAK